MKYEIIDIKEVRRDTWLALMGDGRKMQMVYRDKRLYCDFENNEHLGIIDMDRPFPTFIEMDELIECIQDVFVLRLGGKFMNRILDVANLLDSKYREAEKKVLGHIELTIDEYYEVLNYSKTIEEASVGIMGLVLRYKGKAIVIKVGENL